MPCPYRPERVEETHVLEEVGVEPETRRRSEHGDDEQDQPHYRHGEEQSDQAEHAHAEVPYTLPEEQRPEREQHNRHDEYQRTSGIRLLLPLRTLVEPDVVVVVVGFLVLLDADVPETLHALGFSVVVAFVPLRGVDLGDAQGEEREREQLECVLGGGAVVDFGQQRVLCTRLLVRGRRKGTNGAHDCGLS